MTIYEKLLEVQREIGAIKKDSQNPYFKSMYFDINSLLREVKPILNKHGLVLTQALSNIEGKLALRTTITLPARITKSLGPSDDFKTDMLSAICPLPEVVDPQKVGSAITYFRRYALQSLLALEAEDDDGNVASDKIIKQPVKKNNKVKGTYESETEIQALQELVDASQ